MFVRFTLGFSTELKINDSTQLHHYQLQHQTHLPREQLNHQLDRQELLDRHDSLTLSRLVQVKLDPHDRQGNHLLDQPDHQAHKLPELVRLVS